jgi:hypothetical protein
MSFNLSFRATDHAFPQVQASAQDVSSSKPVALKKAAPL